MRILAKDYAKKVGTSVRTIYNWIRRGLIEGYKIKTPFGSYWEVDSENIPPRPRVGRPRKGDLNEFKDGKSYLLWESQQEAEKYFNSQTGKCKLDYQQVKVRFENDQTLASIGQEAGVSRERIRQYYKTYFEQFMGDKFRKDLRKFNKQVAIREEVSRDVEDHVTLSKLKIFSEEFGWRFEPITVMDVATKNGRVNWRANGSRVLINNKKIYYKTMSEGGLFQIPGGKRFYHRVIVTLGQLTWADYVVMMEDSLERPDRGFVIPSEVIRERYNGETKKGYWLYVPTKKLPSYKNQYPKIDWWEWEDRWDLLDKE